MKFTLLLIPLIFLSSCTIDWNGEKDTTVSSEVELENRIIDSDSGITNFGSGFSLSQTNDETTLSYGGKVVKTWSHTPPERVPFIWDEACTIVWKGFNKLSPGNQSTGKQGVWDSLAEKEKKECMKESLGKSIHTEPTQNPQFYSIFQSGYESYNQWIYDALSGNIQDVSDSFYSIKSIESKENYITITVEEGQSIGLQYVLIYDKDFAKKMGQWPENNGETVEITRIDLANSNTLSISARTIGETTPKDIKHNVVLP